MLRCSCGNYSTNATITCKQLRSIYVYCSSDYPSNIPVYKTAECEKTESRMSREITYCDPIGIRVATHTSESSALIARLKNIPSWFQGQRHSQFERYLGPGTWELALS